MKLLLVVVMALGINGNASGSEVKLSERDTEIFEEVIQDLKVSNFRNLETVIDMILLSEKLGPIRRDLETSRVGICDVFNTEILFRSYLMVVSRAEILEPGRVPKRAMKYAKAQYNQTRKNTAELASIYNALCK